RIREPRTPRFGTSLRARTEHSFGDVEVLRKGRGRVASRYRQRRERVAGSVRWERAGTVRAGAAPPVNILPEPLPEPGAEGPRPAADAGGTARDRGRPRSGPEKRSEPGGARQREVGARGIRPVLAPGRRR